MPLIATEPQSIYIAKIEKQGGRYVPVVIDTFEKVKDTQ